MSYDAPRSPAKEAALHRLLAPALPVPRVFFAASENAITGHPYMLREWVDGERLELVAHQLGPSALMTVNLTGLLVHEWSGPASQSAAPTTVPTPQPTVPVPAGTPQPAPGTMADRRRAASVPLLRTAWRAVSGQLPEMEVEHGLYAAAERHCLVADDGERAVQKTIRSGLNAGLSG